MNDLQTMDYNEYLKTEHWKNLRKRRMKRDSFKCRKCKSNKNLCVHHLTYERRGNEHIDDLITLCKDCHEKIHDYFKFDYFVIFDIERDLLIYRKINEILNNENNNIEDAIINILNNDNYYLIDLCNKTDVLSSGFSRNMKMLYKKNITRKIIVKHISSNKTSTIDRLKIFKEQISDGEVILKMINNNEYKFMGFCNKEQLV